MVDEYIYKKKVMKCLDCEEMIKKSECKHRCLKCFKKYMKKKIKNKEQHNNNKTIINIKNLHIH